MTGRVTPMTDEQRSALVQEHVEADRIDRAKQTKHCPSCGSPWLGGVKGDRSLVACVDCGHVTAKYLSSVGNGVSHLIGRTIVAVDDKFEDHARLLFDNGDVLEFRAKGLLYRIHSPIEGNPDNHDSFGPDDRGMACLRVTKSQKAVPARPESQKPHG